MCAERALSRSGGVCSQATPASSNFISMGGRAGEGYDPSSGCWMPATSFIDRLYVSDFYIKYAAVYYLYGAFLRR